MRYRELAILLPCHSLEDFPLYHVGEDADSVLACWTALWHPALIATAESPPKWHRVDYPPEDLTNKLLLVPTISVSQLPTGFGQRAKEEGSVLIRGETDRQKIISRALAELGEAAQVADADTVADFFALGYAYLQVQVLTRQMRYASNLDEVHFGNLLVAAAQAVIEKNAEEVRAKLSACFDLLGEERDHYYSVDAYLIDLTLVAESTLGASLQQELLTGTPINLMLDGSTARQLARQAPELTASIREALDKGQLGIVGGEREEARLPLLACEDVLAELQAGQRDFQEVLGRSAEVYARRRFGLTPFLPGVLEKLRFRGAVHATLDDGHFPSGSQIKTRWQGVDTSVVDAIAKPPLDASKPETFLGLAQKLGESMDSDHVATLCLAHWPGHASPWYEDLRRTARFTSALGRFLTMDRYFADTYLPGHLDRFEWNQYKSPYLRQDVIRKQANPLSRWSNYWRRRALADANGSLSLLIAAISGRVPESWSERSEVASVLADDAALASRLATEFETNPKRLAELLPRQSVPAQPAYLVLNPWSFTRRVGVDVSQLPQLPDAEKPVCFVDENGSRKLAVVDVPPLGYAWITSGGQPGSPQKRNKNEPQLAEDGRAKDSLVWLRNEFMEASIHPVTGALHSLKDYNSRGARLSQQLALRFPGERGEAGSAWRDPDESASYSVMAADDIQVASTSVLGEVVTQGRLLKQDGEPVARYRQQWRLWRGTRVLEVDIDLEPLVDNTSDAWNSYYASRFAWSDEAAELYVGGNEIRQPVTKPRLEAPLYIEIESGNQRTTILTGGLPFHRRVGDRMLDSLLVVRGEHARSFRFGIGIDVAQPLPEALHLLTPLPSLFQTAPPPTPTTSWLFHIDARSVVATHWSPLLADGQVVGVRTRLLESSGQSCRARLSGFRAFVTARQVNFLGEPVSDLLVQDGRVVLDLTASEWVEVEARWS